MKYSSLMEIGREQHGLATIEQLHRHYSDTQIMTMCRNGVIQRIVHAVYRIIGSDDTWEQRLHAKVLQSDRGVASHYSAARLWGIWSTNRTEVTVPFDANARPPDFHRSRYMERIKVVDNIPLMNPGRTLVDIAPRLSDSALDQVLQRVLTKEVATFAGIRNELELLRTPARSGVAILERKLDSFDPLDERNISNFAKQVLREFCRRNLPEPIPEYLIVVEGINRYIDYAYPELRLAIEVDTRGFHARLLDLDKDRIRSNGINALGWTLMTVSDRTFLEDVDRIERFLAVAAA